MSLNNKGFENLNTEQFKAIIGTDPNAVLLDVRTKQEHDFGHIQSSINIDFLEASFLTNIETLDKDKSYLVYCRSGMRSAKAANSMHSKGFTTIYNLSGGFNAWK